MSDMQTGTARRATVLLSAVLIIAAALLWHHLPVPTQIYAPFDVHGSMGSPVHGTSFAVTAIRARVAPKGKFYVSQHFSNLLLAAGTWLVVDTTVAAVTSTQLPTADLVVGGNIYQPSSQAPPGFGHVDPGVPQHGHWVFDVAPELIQPSVTKPLQLRVWPAGEDRLNSRVVIDLGNRPLERVDNLTVKPNEVGPAE